MRSHELAKILLQLSDSKLQIRIHFSDKKDKSKTIIVGAELEEIVNDSYDNIGFGGSGCISLLSCYGKIQDRY